MRDPAGERHEEERLSGLLDDELSEEDALDVTRHVSSCARCMAELEEIRSARAALRGLPRVDPPPELFPAARRAAVRAGGQQRRRWGVIAAAALTVVAAGVGAWATADRAGVVPPVDNFVVQHVTRAGSGPMLVPVDLAPGRR